MEGEGKESRLMEKDRDSKVPRVRLGNGRRNVRTWSGQLRRTGRAVAETGSVEEGRGRRAQESGYNA